MTSTDIEVVDLTELVGDVQNPCDWSDADYCSKEHAQWAAHAVCPSCGGSMWYLICSPCKNLVMVTDDAFECARCGEVVCPARKFIAQLEGLK